MNNNYKTAISYERKYICIDNTSGTSAALRELYKQIIMKMKIFTLLLALGCCLFINNAYAQQCAKTCTKAKTTAVQKDAKTATAVTVATVTTTSTKKVCNPANCDPANCDPSKCPPNPNCDPKACEAKLASMTPEQRAACKKICTAKTVQKTQAPVKLVANKQE